MTSIFLNSFTDFLKPEIFFFFLTQNRALVKSGCFRSYEKKWLHIPTQRSSKLSSAVQEK